MAGNWKRKAKRGQGLVEYALILALVAIVSIVVLSIIGWGAQRVYALVAGGLGGRYDSYKENRFLDIEYAACIVAAPPYRSPAQTSLYILGRTNIPLEKLTYSVENGVAVTVDGVEAGPATLPGVPDGFQVNYIYKWGADTTLCPKVAVLQSQSAQDIAFSKLTPIVCTSTVQCLAELEKIKN